MRKGTAEVKNIRNLHDASVALRDRAPGVPGIALMWGPTGAGKTTGAAWLADQLHAVHARAMATWTPRSMLAAIMRELEAPPLHSSAAMAEWIGSKLAETGRPLFVDEADYLLGKKAMLETLRDLHDVSRQPLLLIGMADFRRRITHQPQLAGRISQWIEFGPADLDDVRVLARTVCEVELDDELLELLLVRTGGSMRGLIVGMSRIEAHARRRGMDTVTAADWADRPLTLSSTEIRGGA